MLVILLCVFFGAIAYAISGDFLWAVIIGSAGWIAIFIVLAYVRAFIAVLFEDRKRRRLRARRAARR